MTLKNAFRLFMRKFRQHYRILHVVYSYLICRRCYLQVFHPIDGRLSVTGHRVGTVWQPTSTGDAFDTPLGLAREDRPNISVQGKASNDYFLKE